MTEQKLEELKQIFKDNQKMLRAIGDVTRQSIIMALMETSCTTGMRVGEIQERTHLSRPAVSHHLKILRDANLLTLRKEGTKNYYSIDMADEIESLMSLVTNINELVEHKKMKGK